MMRLTRFVSILITFSGLSFSQTCPALAALTSPSLLNRAWAAYSIAQKHDRRCQTALVSALREAIPFHAAGIDTEQYGYVQSLLDALIQLNDPVPSGVLMAFQKERHAEVILLMSRNPRNEIDLLAMMDRDINTAEWLAVCNLLFQQRSEAFLRKTLSQVAFTHIFEVRDTEGRSLRCGGAVGSGSGLRSFPEGFPPIALYQFDSPDLHGTISGDAVLTFPGPKDIYVRRKVIESGAEEPWDDLAFFPDRNFDRAQYLAALTDLPEEELSQLLSPVTPVPWRDAESFVEQAASELDAQRDRIRSLLARASARGFDVSGLPLHITPVVYDDRAKDRAPLPAIAPEDIAR